MIYDRDASLYLSSALHISCSHEYRLYNTPPYGFFSFFFGFGTFYLVLG